MRGRASFTSRRLGTHQKVKNPSSCRVPKTTRASASKSLPLSFHRERLSVCFFNFLLLFQKVLLEGEGLQGRVASGPIRTVHSWVIPQSRRYKDKMAAKSMRAELSRRTEVWRRPAEFTSLRAGSGDSGPMPSLGSREF